MEDTKNEKEMLLKAIIGVLIIIVIVLLMVGSCDSIKYDVTFDYNNGDGYETINVNENDTLRKPDDPTREGYVFAGWFYNDQEFDFTTKITNNMILEARWKEEGEVDNIVVDPQALTMGPNETAQIKVTAVPKNVNISDLLWSSDDETIVTVDQEGNVKSLKEGVANVTVKTADDKYTVNIKIIITKTIVKVEEISISGSSSVNVGSTIKLKANIKPTNATNQTVTWQSSDTSIATVDANGNVKGQKEGTVTITAITNDGNIKATKVIKVTIKKAILVTDVTIDGPSEVVAGNQITLTATITPSNADNKNLSWSSSDNSTATVDANGRVSGLKEGHVTITVTTEDGGKTASKDIIVKAKPVNYTVTLTALVQATGATDQYEIAVSKDGQALTDYAYILFGNTRVLPTNKTVSNALTGNGSVKTLRVYLDANTYVTANVVYSRRNIE